MSEESNESNETVVNEPKAAVQKKPSIANGVVFELVAGLPQYSKASFLMIGHRNGVRIAIPKTKGIGRAYFYGAGDYSLVPSHEAIVVFSEEQRKEHRRGGIMAEVDFGKGIALATEALTLLVDVVRNAPAPAPKGAKEPKSPKAPKKAKEVPSIHVVDGSDCLTDPADIAAVLSQTPDGN